MSKIKQNDFVEIDYTGSVKDGDMVFDTTEEKVAKEHHIYSKNSAYGPVVIAVGAGHVVKGVDARLIGVEPGVYTFQIPAAEGFGKKDAKMLKVIATGAFHKQQIQPVPGLQVNIDGMYGIVKTVTGGRSLVDFNHPLSGKDLVYAVKVNRIVESDGDKVAGLLKLKSGIVDAKVVVVDGTATVSMKKEVPPAIQARISEELLPLIPTLRKLEFAVLKEEPLNNHLNDKGPKVEG